MAELRRWAQRYPNTPTTIAKVAVERLARSTAVTGAQVVTSAEVDWVADLRERPFPNCTLCSLATFTACRPLS